MPLYLRDKLVSGTGAQGSPGKSAYQTAVEAGYMGDEAAFNSALKDVPAHIADSDVHVTVTQKSEWDNKAESIHAARHAAGGADPITPASIGADPSGSAATVQSNLDGHTGNTTVHITAAERTKWNDKQDKLTGAQGQIVGFGPDGKAVAQDKPTYAASEVGAIPTTEKGAANGVATLGADALLAAAQRPKAGGLYRDDGNTTLEKSLTDISTTLQNKAATPKSVSVTLASASWDSTAKTQTVTVTGVSATETAQMITPTPALASQTAYYDAGILCTGQAADSLTFTANTIPTADLTVYVVIQEVAQG